MINDPNASVHIFVPIRVLIWKCAFPVSLLKSESEGSCVMKDCWLLRKCGQQAPGSRRTLAAFQGLSPHFLSLKKMMQMNYYSVNI